MNQERVDVTVVFERDEKGKTHAILVEPARESPRRKAKSDAEIKLGIIQAIIEKARRQIRALSLRGHDNQHVDELAQGVAIQAFREIEEALKK